MKNPRQPAAGAEREALILSLGEKVRILAAKRYRSLPRRVRFQELESAGWLGAIQAVDGFDPAHGVELATYADWKIRGAMADYLRSLDPLSRGHRHAVSSGAAPEVRTYSLDPGHAPPQADDSCFHHDTPQLDYLHCDRAERDQRRLDARLTLEAIRRRARVDPRHAEALERWLAGEPMAEIGRSMGVGTSRVSQMCATAVAALRLAAGQGACTPLPSHASGMRYRTQNACVQSGGAAGPPAVAPPEDQRLRRFVVLLRLAA